MLLIDISKSQGLFKAKDGLIQAVIDNYDANISSLKGVDREKSAVFKELTPSFRTYELHGQGGEKKL